MKRDFLDPVEAMVVDQIKTSVSDNEAKEARLVLLWMKAFFAARWATLLTASAFDVEAFCDERAKTRRPSSMARLILVVKQIFRTSVGLQLRSDDPSIDLTSPPTEIPFVEFGVDDAHVRKLLDGQRSITNRAPKRAIFVQTRRLAILSLSVAGAFCTEISALDFLDVSMALAAGEYIRIGRSAANERELLLGGRGLLAVNNYIALRRDMPRTSEEALFVSHHIPFNRLNPRSVSNEISLSIRDSGLKGSGLTPRALHRSLAGDALKAGQGGKVAAAAGGYSLLPFSKPALASSTELSDLIEQHHPMGRLPYA